MSLHESSQKYVASLTRSGRFVWAGIFIQSVLFSFYGLHYFLSNTLATHRIWPVIVFSLLAVFTFFYATHFFSKYTQLRFQKIISLPEKNRKESLMLALVIQFLLVQFICILGILLSVFQQHFLYVYPFFVAFCIGMWKSWPQQKWFEKFYGAENAQKN